jgi:uncharacterized protein YndB with AHSA1/START domain
MANADSPAAAGSEFILTRTLAAPRALVWQVWTEPAHLMQWFGPAGMTMPRCTMDLRVGGRFHFCLRAPDGQDMWALWQFGEIVAPERLVWLHGFADPQGKPARHPMAPSWPLQMLSTLSFAERDGQTEMRLHWVAHDATAQEQHSFDTSHASMQMGWAGTMAQLDAHLARVKGI